MKKTLSELIGKKFSVYVAGEFERMTDFIGFLDLLSRYSDYFNYERAEKINYLKGAVKDKYAYIDANIYVKIGR